MQSCKQNYLMDAYLNLKAAGEDDLALEVAKLYEKNNEEVKDKEYYDKYMLDNQNWFDWMPGKYPYRVMPYKITCTV